MRSGSLVVCDGPLEGAALSRAIADDDIDLSSATLCSHFNEATQLPASSFTFAACLASSTGFPNQAVLNALQTSLKPSSQVAVYLTQDSPVDELKSACILSGFEMTQGSTPSKLIARKPEWESGSQAAISFKRKSAPVAGNIWKLSEDDFGLDEDLVDEDDLLMDDDLKPPAPVDGASKPVKKACKDCTCGRAEAEAKGVKVELTQDMLDNPQSACGSCGLGDAFRCGTCPYRGLPAFEPGKKIELPSDFLVADA